MAISPLGDHHLLISHPEADCDVVAPDRPITAHREQVVVHRVASPLGGSVILFNLILAEGEVGGRGDLLPAEEGEDVFGGLGSHNSY